MFKKGKNIFLTNIFQAPLMPKFASGIPNSHLVKAKKDDPGVMLDQNGNYVVRKTDKLVFINYSWFFLSFKIFDKKCLLF